MTIKIKIKDDLVHPGFMVEAETNIDYMAPMISRMLDAISEVKNKAAQAENAKQLEFLKIEGRT